MRRKKERSKQGQTNKQGKATQHTHVYTRLLSFSLQITLFQQFPQLKSCVLPSVEKAVQDLLLPVVDRSIKIALTTTEHIVKKVIERGSTRSVL